MRWGFQSLRRLLAKRVSLTKSFVDLVSGVLACDEELVRGARSLTVVFSFLC